MRSILAIATAALIGSRRRVGNTEITFYTIASAPAHQGDRRLRRGFEKAKPAVKVKPIYAGNYDDARIKALAALKAASPPRSRCSFDRHLRADRAGVISLGRRRHLRAGQGWIKSSTGADDDGTYKGKAYGIPFQRSTIVMYWNKDAFRRRPRPREGTGQLDRDDADGGQAREEGCLGKCPAGA